MQTSPPWPASATSSVLFGRNATPRGASRPGATVATVHALVVAPAPSAAVPRTVMSTAATTRRSALLLRVRRLLILTSPSLVCGGSLPAADKPNQHPARDLLTSAGPT